MPGFKITIPFIERLFKSVILADLLQKLLTKTGHMKYIKVKHKKHMTNGLIIAKNSCKI